MTNVEALKLLASGIFKVDVSDIKGETISEVLIHCAVNYAGVKIDSEMGVLEIKSVKGSNDGFTALTITPSLTSGNSYRYKTAPSDMEIPEFKADLSDWLTWDGSSDIEGEDGHEICVCEVDSNNLAVKGGKTIIYSI